jgi:hypothetical protein
MADGGLTLVLPLVADGTFKTAGAQGYTPRRPRRARILESRASISRDSIELVMLIQIDKWYLVPAIVQREFRIRLKRA